VYLEIPDEKKYLVSIGKKDNLWIQLLPDQKIEFGVNVLLYPNKETASERERFFSFKYSYGDDEENLENLVFSLSDNSLCVNEKPLFRIDQFDDWLKTIMNTPEEKRWEQRDPIQTLEDTYAKKKREISEEFKLKLQKIIGEDPVGKLIGGVMNRSSEEGGEE